MLQPGLFYQFECSVHSAADRNLALPRGPVLGIPNRSGHLLHLVLEPNQTPSSGTEPDSGLRLESIHDLESKKDSLQDSMAGPRKERTDFDKRS